MNVVVCVLSLLVVSAPTAKSSFFSAWTAFMPSQSAETRYRSRSCIASDTSLCLETDFFYEQYTDCPPSCNNYVVNITRTPCGGICDLATISRWSVCTTDSTCTYEQRWYCIDGDSCSGAWSDWAVTQACNKLCGGGNTTRRRECTEGGIPSGRCGGTMGETFQEVTETCNLRSCPFYSTWSDYSACSQTCGGGSQSRTRTCYDADGVHPTGVGCGLNDEIHEEEVTVCQTQDCPQYDPWVDGDCSQTCGSGTLTRTRTCKYLGAVSTLCPGADASGMQSEIISCNTNTCPAYGPWIPGTCSVTCGTGTQDFHRECLLNGAPSTGCDGPSTKQEPCTLAACPCDPWEDVGVCSEPCNGGVITQNRDCNGVIETREVDCNTEACPCDPWEDVGVCSEPCDGGVITQNRDCNGVIETREVDCNTEACTYGSWMDVTSCDANCGGGVIEQERHCTVASCDKVQTREISCNSQACGCTSWDDTSQCSRTCGGGTLTQERNCTEPTSFRTETRTIDCNTANCDCSEWSDVSECSVLCGGGSKTQERFCELSGSTEQRQVACNEQECACDPWTDNSTCPVTCGGGEKLQGRECVTPDQVVQENRTIDCNTEPCITVTVGGGSFTWLIVLASIVGSAFLIALIYLCIPFCCVCCVVAGDRKVTAISALVINSIQVGSLGMIQWRGKTRLQIKRGAACWGCCGCCGGREDAGGDNIPMVRIFGTSDQPAAEQGEAAPSTEQPGMTQVGLGGDDANMNDLTAWASQMMNESKEISTTEVYELNNTTANNNSVRSHQSLLQPSQPTTVHMLNHVNNLRKTGLPKTSNIFSQDSIIACLVHVQQHCDESCQSRFSDLFALVNDSDDEILLRDLRASRKRAKASHRTSKSKSSQSSRRNSEDSNSASSSDDEDTKRKRKRKIRANDSSESE